MLLVVRMLPGTRTVGAAALAAAALALAPATGMGSTAQRCAGADRVDLPPAAQERAMRCLINSARRAKGLRPVRAHRRLARSAAQKNALMARCDDFSHTACGRAFTHTFDRAGYRGRSVGENIAWGTGRRGTPRAIHNAWMRSPGHRRNILSPRWREVGVDVRRWVRFQGYSGAALWTAQYGVR
jgi:uncharacterized protein YkwD